MPKKDVLTKILAAAGAFLAWIPILAPLLFSAAGAFRQRPLHVDYLMPAELFPAALIGGALLVWAAARARSRLKPIGWGLGLAAACLVGGQILAVVTGLASGAAAPEGLPWILVLASLAAYTLAVLFMACEGILLLNDLFSGRRNQAIGH